MEYRDGTRALLGGDQMVSGECVLDHEPSPVRDAHVRK